MMTTAGMAWASWSNTPASAASRAGSNRKPFRWDYTRFGRADTAVPAPDETIELTIVKRNAALGGFNQWTLNGDRLLHADDVAALHACTRVGAIG